MIQQIFGWRTSSNLRPFRQIKLINSQHDFFSVALNLEDFYHQVNRKRKTFQEALNVSEIYDMLNNRDNKITSLSHHNFRKDDTQPAFTFSKLTIEILEQGVKYFQS